MIGEDGGVSKQANCGITAQWNGYSQSNGRRTSAAPRPLVYDFSLVAPHLHTSHYDFFVPFEVDHNLRPLFPIFLIAYVNFLPSTTSHRMDLNLSVFCFNLTLDLDIFPPHTTHPT